RRQHQQLPGRLPGAVRHERQRLGVDQLLRPAKLPPAWRLVLQRWPDVALWHRQRARSRLSQPQPRLPLLRTGLTSFVRSNKKETQHATQTNMDLRCVAPDAELADD